MSMLCAYRVVKSVLSCTTVVGSSVIVTGAGVTSTVEGSSVTVDGARVSVVRMMLFSTTVTGGGVTYMVLVEQSASDPKECAESKETGPQDCSC